MSTKDYSEKFTKESRIIIEKMLEVDKDQALTLANEYIKKVYDDMAQFQEKAKKYFTKREESNKNILLKTEQMMKEMKNKFKDATFIGMSSIDIKVNLIGDSDIDIGMFISNADENFEEVKQELEEIGFKFKKLCNKDCLYYKYYSFENDIYEIKLMDIEKTTAIVNLYDHMKLLFSENEEYPKRFTFLKKILNKYARDEKVANGYNFFKYLMFEGFFKDIGTGFLFTWLTKKELN